MYMYIVNETLNYKVNVKLPKSGWVMLVILIGWAPINKRKTPHCIMQLRV